MPIICQYYIILNLNIINKLAYLSILILLYGTFLSIYSNQPQSQMYFKFITIETEHLI